MYIFSYGLAMNFINIFPGLWLYAILLLIRVDVNEVQRRNALFGHLHYLHLQ